MQLSDLLQQAIDELELHASNSNHPQGLVARLTDFRSALEAIRDDMVALQELVPLEVHKSDEEDVVDFETISLKELVEQSVLIGAIHRSGVDVKGRTVFSPDEIKLARTIVGNFDQFSGPLASFRSAAKGKQGDWIMHAPGGSDIFDFFDALVAIGAVNVKFVNVRKDGKWQPFRWEWGRASKPSQNFFICYQLVDTKVGHFITGDWMTAFVSDVIRDHLERNNIRHELFAKVRYEGPVDLGHSKSDFDVVALQVGQRTAHSFECKSGRLTEAEVADVIAKGSHIKDVLERLSDGIDTVRLYLVYDHLLNDEGIRPA